MHPPSRGSRGVPPLSRFVAVLPAAMLAVALTSAAVPASAATTSEAAPAGAATPATTPGPPTPTALWASTTGTAIALTWQQPRTGPYVRSFRVYEGDRVVARHTSTSVQLNVAFGSSHTYTVTAVDADGRESARSAPVTGRSWLSGVNPECLPVEPLPITVTSVSASAISVSWPRHPLGGELELRVDGVSQGWTPLTSARIGGLAPQRTYTVTLHRYQYCFSPGLTTVGSTSVTTSAGPTARPPAPDGLTVTGQTDTTLSLSWTAPAGPPPARYAVYEGGTRVAVSQGTTVTVDRLFHGTSHQFTVAALDAVGSESAHSAAVSGSTATCLSVPPRPLGLAATVLSASSVRLAWTFDSLATSYTVYDGASAVVTTSYPEVVVSGLPSASRHEYRISATLPGACGETPRGTPVEATTAAGPAARPAAPIGLAVTGNTPGGSGTQLTLTWSASTGAEPAVGYRVYEGGTVVGTTASTSLALIVGPATWHAYTVVAVDAAGNESVASRPVSVQAMFLPPP